MIGFRHRWEIPSEMETEFRNDWTELTESNGSDDATLHNMGDGRFISLVVWGSPQLWEAWKTGIHNHPLRVKYRPFIKRGPTAISPTLAKRMRMKLTKKEV